MPCHAFAVRQLLFGVSAAGYRVEGGFNGYGEPANQWLAWELAGKVPRAQDPTAGVWADPSRLLDLASSAGAQVLALGVEWARIEPAPGRLDEAALDRYASILTSASERGLTPIGVLHDVAHPAWLGEEFWLTPGAPDRFGDHAGCVVERLAQSCDRWVTMRQPNLVALAGWVNGRHPPRRNGALADAWAVVDNFLTAHVLAYSAIHDVQPEADVSFGVRASSSYDWQRLMVDLLCAPALGVERDELDAWVDARRTRYDGAFAPSDLGDLLWRRASAATSPFGVGGVVRDRLRRSSPRRAVDVVYRFAAERPPPAVGSNGSARSAQQGPVDSLLLVWCPPHAQALLPRVRRAAPWEVRPDPGAFTGWCLDQTGATPGIPVLAEDGFATRSGAPRPDGWDRRAYLRAQISALRDVPLAAYLYYSPGRGGDPTWPDADFGLGHEPGEGGPNGDADFYRLLVEDRRSVRDSSAGPN